ncbi:1116_t:CDS:2, partial [Acaulospora morrowiae]
MQCTETSKRWFAAILDVTLILVMFLCPALGIAKVELFKGSNGEIYFNNIIEYGYIIISLIIPCKHLQIRAKTSMGIDLKNFYIKLDRCRYPNSNLEMHSSAAGQAETIINVNFMLGQYFGSGYQVRYTVNSRYRLDKPTIIISTFQVVYTVLTINEMGNIPFSCPSDYPYSSEIIRTACQVRTANLISMWILEAISIIFVVAIFENWLPKPCPLQKTKNKNASMLLKDLKNRHDKHIARSSDKASFGSSDNAPSSSNKMPLIITSS